MYIVYIYIYIYIYVRHVNGPQFLSRDRTGQRPHPAPDSVIEFRSSDVINHRISEFRRVGFDLQREEENIETETNPTDPNRNVEP